MNVMKLIIALFIFLSISKLLYAQYATPYLTTNRSHVTLKVLFYVKL